jgi:hypothetical protein
MPSRPHRRWRGSALLLALGVLALLAGFAVALLAVVRLERRASGSWVDGRRAGLVAEAGVHRALVELSSTFSEPLATRLAPWTYLDANGDFAHGIPLLGAPRCSLEDGTTLLENGTSLPISGHMGGTYDAGGDVYTLKVLDVTSQIDLNDERPDLARMLDTLGRAIGDHLQKKDPVRGRGAAIVAARELVGRFSSKRELEPVLSRDQKGNSDPQQGALDWKLLADFVTVDGWQDPAARRLLGPAERPPGGDPSLPAFASERRCPINVNGAPKPTLVALFAGVKSEASEPVSYDTAGDIADRIVARRKSPDPTEGPFRDVVELDDFVLGLAAPGSRPRLTQEQAEALVADLDPNVTIEELNPDALERLPVTKGELEYRTTDATVISHGRFEVTSVGRLLEKGAIVAEAVRVAIVRAYEVARHTTQGDFDGSALAATSENCPSFPNGTRRPGIAQSNDSGYVQLCDRMAQAPGDLLGGEVLAAAYTSALDALDQGRTVAATGTRRADRPATTGGDLNPDGTRTSPDRRVLDYGSAPPPDEGTLDLWLKLDEDAAGTTGSIVEIVNALPQGVVMLTELSGGSDGTTLSLDLDRKVFFPGTAVVPFAHSETKSSTRLVDLGTFGEWHAIRIAWGDGTDARLYVDGEIQPVVLRAPLDSTQATGVPPIPGPWTDRLVVGGHDGVDGPLWRKMTVDDVVVHGGPVELTSSFSPPERYPPVDPSYVGRFVGAFGPFSEPVEYGTLYWTARTPRSWGHVQFTSGDFSVNVIGSGQGADGVSKVEEIDGDHHDGKGRKKSVPPSDAGVPGGESGGHGHGGGGHGGGGQGGGRSGGGQGGGSSPQASPLAWLYPEVANYAPGSGPSQDGLCVFYEFRFRYVKTGLLAKGLAIPPLNVSPILDDVTLVYRTRPLILRMEEDDD